MTPTEPNLYSLDFYQDGWYVTRNGQPIKGPFVRPVDAQMALVRVKREDGHCDGREAVA